ncbi:MAG: apolipoprotein N-acyltransferase [Clostridia bacterium]|nr:apolipoprotein N-acyltransferase [Clostridia bacterium]
MRFFLYALSGALTALPMIAPSFWFVAWVSVAPVLYLESFSKEKASYPSAYGRGMSFFFVFGLFNFYWFWELYPLDFLGFEKGAALLVVILASVGIPLLQGAVSSFYFVILSFMKRRGFFESHPFLGLLFSAFLWPIFEFCHTLTFLGVPWGRLCAGQTSFTPSIQSASLLGSFFVSFLMILTSATLAFAIKEFKRKSVKRAFLFSSLAILVFASNLVFGVIRIEKVETELSPDTTVACVQGNIRFEDKWVGKAQYTLDLHRNLTIEAAEEGADIVLWPETALPYDISEDPYLENSICEIAKDADCTLIATAFSRDSRGRLYNTARLINNKGSQVGDIYAKRHLVPFGEYTPYEDLIRKIAPPLADLSAIDDPVTPGESTALFETDKGKIGSLICFDSVYEDLCRKSVLDGAGLICVSTNDSWFSGSSALRQHNSHAILRAVENKRYVARAANTGISSIISPTGKVLTSLGDSEEGVITEKVSFIEDTTLFTILGNVFIPVCAVFCLINIIYASIESLKRKKK